MADHPQHVESLVVKGLQMEAAQIDDYVIRFNIWAHSRLIPVDKCHLPMAA
jgi:hypothetical protein